MKVLIFGFAIVIFLLPFVAVWVDSGAAYAILSLFVVLVMALFAYLAVRAISMYY